MLALAGSSYASCVGYHEEFDVRVLDAKGRPVPLAETWIKYDRGSTFGEQYFTTPLQTTDQNGVVHYTVINQGTTSRTIDCTIIAGGKVNDINSTVSVIAEAHGTPVDVKLEVYPVQIYVRDHLGAPIANATVSIGSDRRKSGADGRLFYYFKSGPYNYLASYMDGKASGTFEVHDDMNLEITFPYHKIVVDITDDNNAPLNATITIMNKTLVMENGHFEMDRVFGEKIPYSIEYMGIMEEGEIEPAIESTKKIILDIHSPTIGKIDTSITDNKPKLLIAVSDLGVYASGVDFKSAKVQYRLLPADISTPWNSAVTYTSGRNEITAEFPEMPPSRIVQFRMEIKDKDGNMATVEGKFSTMGQTTQNDTKNETKPPEVVDQNQGIPLIYIFIGVIIAILAIYAVFRLKAGEGKSA